MFVTWESAPDVRLKALAEVVASEAATFRSTTYWVGAEERGHEVCSVRRPDETP